MTTDDSADDSIDVVKVRELVRAAAGLWSRASPVAVLLAEAMTELNQHRGKVVALRPRPR